MDDPSLNGLGLLLRVYFDAKTQQARRELNTEIATLASQRRALSAEKKAIAKLQKECDRRNQVTLARARSLKNDKFIRWLDNTSWSVRTFWNDARGIRRVVLIHWLIFFPLALIGSFRIAASDQCNALPQCRDAVRSLTGK